MTQPPRNSDAGPNLFPSPNGRGQEYSTLPEVIPGFGNRDMTLPEVRHPEQEKMLVGAGTGYIKPVGSTPPPAPPYPELGVATAHEEGPSADAALAGGDRSNWFRRQRKRVLVGIAAVILLVVAAVVVGAVVGTQKAGGGGSGSTGSPESSNGGSGSGSGSNTPGGGGGGSGTSTAPSVFGVPTTFPDPPNGQTLLSTCQGTVCPQMLATVQFGSPRTTYIFARGADNAFWYRSVTSGAWEGEWKSLGGNFISQPTAASMREGRIDIFGVWGEDRSPRYKTFQNGVWDTDWTRMNGICSSQLSMCSRGLDHLNIIHLDSANGVWHKYMDDGVNWKPSKWEGQGGYSSSTIDLGCAPLADGSPGRADMVAYGRGNPDYGMTYRKTNSTGGWGGWANATGAFDGDPTVLSGVDTADYFGIATDGSMRHRRWLSSTNAVEEEVNLGGNFQSAVAAFATGTSRIDVIAVGTDARAYHKARIGQTWGTSWENLGGWFNSAPRAVVTGDGEAVVFGLGPNGTIIHTNIKIGENFNWGPTQWYSDGGSMTARWYRLGPA